MPNLNGTGPGGQGPMTGRRRGRCFNKQSVQGLRTESRSDEIKEVVYGVGRGGRPRGCGQGNCYGGNKRKGQRGRFGN
jgi:hypothetical protein